MKKRIATLLAAIMTATSVSVVFGAGLNFTDVKKSDWFYQDVESAVEMGLVSGKSETTYCPEDNLTYAEAIKLAACMNQLYVDGKITLKAGDPWYMPFVEYCKAEGIITGEYNFNEKATRAGYMEIFANALPDDGLEEINYIEENGIPDVPSNKSYAAPIYKLYRAGILTGVDAEHNCSPFANIKRSEVAAILTRMMNQEKRVSFNIGEAPEKDPTEQPTETPEEPKEEPSEQPTEEPKEEPTENPDAMPLVAQIVPEEADIKDGEFVEISVVAKQGVEPYTYNWLIAQVKPKAKFSTREYIAVDPEALDIDQLSVAGNKMSFFASQELLTKYDRVKCEIVDAEGTKVETKECILKYAGSGKNNDLTQDNFYMFVEDKLSVKDRGYVLTGRVVSGKLKKGDAIKIYKGDGYAVTATVEGIEMFKKMLDEASAGDNIGLLLGGVSEEVYESIGIGSVVGGYNDKYVMSDYIFGTFTPAEEGVTFTPKTEVNVNFGNTADVNAYISPDSDEEGVFCLDFDYKYYGVWYVGQILNIRKDGKKLGTFVVNNVWDASGWMYDE